jgi:hypothetical protein
MGGSGGSPGGGPARPLAACRCLPLPACLSPRGGQVLDPAERGPTAPDGFAHLACWEVGCQLTHSPLPPTLLCLPVRGVQVLDPAGKFSHTACWQSSPHIAAWLRTNFPRSRENHADNAYIW